MTKIARKILKRELRSKNTENNTDCPPTFAYPVSIALKTLHESLTIPLKTAAPL
ncbi:hypothetical protein [Bartonella capreoli]|uniref:hypothetical protein n=1 Tax=Bartonella capreoli TaxID=155192 RepID=UPI001ABD23B8|nr:hypothetical protein [Bartonella capreoli]